MTTPYLDLSKTILQPSQYEEDNVDELRVREVLLEATAGTPFWGNNPAAYDMVRFAKNITLPGSVKVSGTCFEQKLQKDKPPGTHGASVKQLGLQPAKMVFTLRMWTAEHLAIFEKLVPILKGQKYETESFAGETINYEDPFADYSRIQSTRLNEAGFGPMMSVNQATTNLRQTERKTRKVPVGPQPMDVYHPWLALFKIRSVHVLRVDFPEPVGGSPDIWEVRVHCEEFVAKRASAVKTANESLAITEATLGPTAIKTRNPTAAPAAPLTPSAAQRAGPAAASQPSTDSSEPTFQRFGEW